MPPEISSSQRRELSKVFLEIDKNNDGHVSFYELKSFIVEKGYQVSDEDVRNMMIEAGAQ